VRGMRLHDSYIDYYHGESVQRTMSVSPASAAVAATEAFHTRVNGAALARHEPGPCSDVARICADLTGELPSGQQTRGETIWHASAK